MLPTEKSLKEKNNLYNQLNLIYLKLTHFLESIKIFKCDIDECLICKIVAIYLIQTYFVHINTILYLTNIITPGRLGVSRNKLITNQLNTMSVRNMQLLRT